MLIQIGLGEAAISNNSPLAMAKNVCSIHKFVERDIDMLIAEELRVNPDFCEWIVSHFEIDAQISFPAMHTRFCSGGW